MADEALEVPPAEWDRLYERAIRDYREGNRVTPNGARIERLTVEARGENGIFTDRRELRLEMSDGSVVQVFCHWREFMKWRGALMADETPPLDEAQLEAIRARETIILKLYHDMAPYEEERLPILAQWATEDAPALLAAYERLRAREAAAMVIVREVATGVSDSETGDCSFCGVNYCEAHTADCLVTKACALLAQE